MDLGTLLYLLGTFAQTPELEWPTNTAIDMCEDALMYTGSPRLRLGCDYSYQVAK